MDVVVLTQPGCPRCNTLKKWLKNENIKFGEKPFNTEVQTDMIMLNIFDDPPFLKINEKIISSSEIFETDDKIKSSISEFLINENDSLQPEEVNQK